MRLEDKIYVAGHRGWSVLLTAAGYVNLVTRTHAELHRSIGRNRDSSNTRSRGVFLAAARVGGILANTYPADFIFQNVMIQANAIYAAYASAAGSYRFWALLHLSQARSTTDEGRTFADGVAEPTNEPYGVAKIAGIKMRAAYSHNTARTSWR
jgi:nucleoside-diphosphate-sugar epimerase